MQQVMQDKPGVGGVLTLTWCTYMLLLLGCFLATFGIAILRVFITEGGTQI